jgi:septal ring factor EnvC (AmiA/AmiB activator)
MRGKPARLSDAAVVGLLIVYPVLAALVWVAALLSSGTTRTALIAAASAMTVALAAAVNSLIQSWRSNLRQDRQAACRRADDSYSALLAAIDEFQYRTDEVTDRTHSLQNSATRADIEVREARLTDSKDSKSASFRELTKVVAAVELRGAEEMVALAKLVLTAARAESLSDLASCRAQLVSAGRPNK